MTEEVRDALMRLTMCAREECDVCKYKDKCGFEFQYNISTENMHTILDALSADAVQGEWNTGKPTKRGEYIVTLIGIGDYRFVDIMHYDKPCMPNIEVSGACWYCDDDEWGDVVYDDTDILAWMPLPKPYKGGDTE